jgi:CubicO group peptidase (beta-lactamase class C family)
VQRKTHLVIASLTSLLMSVTAATQQPSFQELDHYIVNAMHDAEVPGLSIAVVKDNAVVFTKGYGVRKVGENAPVDEHTIFHIASVTKGFTTASLAMLVDDGKLGWDDHVLKYLPAFQLYDSYATRELMVRDLLTHRTGLTGNHTLCVDSAYSREEILYRIRFWPPKLGLRAQFDYNNCMYIVAGQIIPAITGRSWDEFVHERIFRPLGMKRSSTSIREIHDDNVAMPHRIVDGTIQSLPLPNNDNMAPAGGINSSALDMAQWVRLQLGGGAYQGQRLLSLQRLKELQSPNIDLDFSEGLDKLQFPADHFAAYSLGWVLMDYHGRKVVFHTGSSPGFKAEILLVPEEHLGVVILSNFFDRPLSWLLGYRVIDAYLGLPARDWAGEYLKALKGFEQENETEKKKREAERNRNTKPSLPMEKYAGRYTNEMYGEAVVSIKDGRTNSDFRGLGWGGELTHWQFDTFEAIWRVPGFERNLATFMLGPNGDVDILRVDGLADFVPVSTSTPTGPK